MLQNTPNLRISASLAANIKPFTWFRYELSKVCSHHIYINVTCL